MTDKEREDFLNFIHQKGGIKRLKQQDNILLVEVPLIADEFEIIRTYKQCLGFVLSGTRNPFTDSSKVKIIDLDNPMCSLPKVNYIGQLTSIDMDFNPEILLERNPINGFYDVEGSNIFYHTAMFAFNALLKMNDVHREDLKNTKIAVLKINKI